MAVSDDALKLLVAEHGVRGTARLLGMDETQTHAFRQRVTRGKWLADPAIASIRKNSDVPMRGFAAAPIVAKMSPQAALASEIAELGVQTRASLARGIAKAGEHIESLPGAEVVDKAQEVKAIAQTASTVHSWDRSAVQPKIRLELLASKGEVTAIDIESEVVTDDWADEY